MTIQIKKFMSIILVAIITISAVLGLNLEASAAAVKIKTQEKADSLLSEGAIRGIDVSKWQGTINWSKVANDNKEIKFAFVRADFGAETDPTFVDNVNGAQKNGIKVGAYHYARFKTTETMEEEAEVFLAQLSKVKLNYPVVLDVENHYGLSKTKLTSLCVEFMSILNKAGYSTMIYTYENFFNQYLSKSSLGDTKVWIANYKEYPSTINHHVWQHTSYAVVDGISTRVDINIAYKDLVTKKPIEVDGAKSKSIVTFLNENTGATLDPEEKAIDMDGVYTAISLGMQKELARDFNGALVETGAVNIDDINTITTLSGKDICSNNIMNYIQARLFYKGLYTEELSGRFDDHTVEAIKGFQGNSGLEANGILNKSTLKKLFNVTEEA